MNYQLFGKRLYSYGRRHALFEASHMVAPRVYNSEEGSIILTRIKDQKARI